MKKWLKRALRWFRDEPASDRPMSGPTSLLGNVRPAKPVPRPSAAESALRAKTPESQLAASAGTRATSPLQLSSVQRPGPATASGNAGMKRHGLGEEERVFLPLQPILHRLPPELKSRVRNPIPADLEISFPLEPLLAQLQQGVVRIPFGQLRTAAAGVFSGGPELDDHPVSLPLDLVIQRIGLERLQRRQDQKVVTLPEEIVGPFGPDPECPKPAGAGTAAVVSAPRHSGDKGGALRGAQPQPLFEPTGSSTETTRIRQTGGQNGAVRVASGAASLPPVHPAPSGPTALPILGPLSPPVPSPAATAGVNGQSVKPQAGPVVPPVTSVGANPVQSAAPQPPPVSSGGPVQATLPGSVQLSVAAVSVGWPEGIRQELARLNLSDAQLVIPASVLEKGLRQGRVEFPWRLIRAWIRPAVATYSSPHDAVPLGLPLAVVAPAFLQQRKPVSVARRQLTVDASIPELFNAKGTASCLAGESTPSPASVSSPVSAPTLSAAAVTSTADTNFYSAQETTDTALMRSGSAASGSAGSSSTTEWVRRSTTPKDVVSRAVALEGVAGALVALPDGLSVASQVPAHLNVETLAAFLPQIYSKVSQCTQELRMGALNNLSFTVGNVPWKVFRVNNLFFAAFGHAGQPMPTAQLAALAAELDRKPKT
ncbi:MAG: hypothetical protein RMN51_04590 [Verrucomicrobiota bacterium]|nr:hypothetical protein [Limisphaera sp.]MDW8381370.1 hypothetical protein [Verrucomicrobiota bacterium]